MITLKGNPNYRVIHTAFKDTKDAIDFYVPNDMENGYGIQRKLEFDALDAFALAGASPEMLDTIVLKSKEYLADEKKTNTEKIQYVWNLISFFEDSRKYPKAEEIALKKASLFLLLDGENPNEVNESFTSKKIQIAMQDADTYAFFLHIGELSIPYWQELPDTLQDENYLRTREMIRARFLRYII